MIPGLRDLDTAYITMRGNIIYTSLEFMQFPQWPWGGTDNTGTIGMTIEQEIEDGLEKITRRMHADWYAKKYITDEIWSKCPPVGEWGRGLLRQCVMKEFRIIDVIAGKTSK